MGVRNRQRMLHFLHSEIHPLGDFFRCGIAAEFLDQRGLAPSHAIDKTSPVQRHLHDATLFSQRLEDRLSYPPHRVGDKADPPGLVKSARGPDQPQIAFIDQIGKRYSLIAVLLGHRHHEAQIGAHEFVERLLFPAADSPGESGLFFLVDKRVSADLLEVLVQRALDGTRKETSHLTTPIRGPQHPGRKTQCVISH